jgi:hypothetical protein
MLVPMAEADSLLTPARLAAAVSAIASGSPYSTMSEGLISVYSVDNGTRLFDQRLRTGTRKMFVPVAPAPYKRQSPSCTNCWNPDFK